MAASHDRAAGPVRVVVADDSADMRSLVRWALERTDGVVVVGEAATADEAVRLAAGGGLDAVLLDLQMPGMEPGALLEAIAAAAPSVPILTFSGYEPDLVAPGQTHLVRLHVPKTTDLALLGAAVLEVGRAAG